METDMNKYIVHSANTEWISLEEEGIVTKGIYVKPLRSDESQKRSPSFLLKFDPGASYPYHNHPAGEEAFVLKGEVYFNDTKLVAGDYLYTPPGFKHAVRTEVGCEIFFIVPQEVEIIV